MGEQTEAARRAAARKAKILARGNTGLNKLAQTARGEEAEKLYGETSRPSTPATKVETEAEESAKPSWAPPPPSTTGPASSSGGARPPPSAEQQQMTEQLNAMMSMFGGGPGGAGAEGQPDMSQLFAQMMAGAGPGAGGMPADRLLGDLDDPAGLGGPPPGFPDMSALGQMGGMGGGMPGFPGMVAPRRSWIERVFPLIHALAMVLLVGFTVIWWEPRVGAGRSGYIGRGWAERWGDLRGAKRFGDDFRISALLQGVDVLPMFWAFTTVELIIQTTRFLLLKSPPPPHSLLQTFLPLMPPHLSRPILTASRYFSLLSQTLKDGFLLVFLLGLVVIFADHRQ